MQLPDYVNPTRSEQAEEEAKELALERKWRDEKQEMNDNHLYQPRPRNETNEQTYVRIKNDRKELEQRQREELKQFEGWLSARDRERQERRVRGLKIFWDRELGLQLFVSVAAVCDLVNGPQSTPLENSRVHEERGRWLWEAQVRCSLTRFPSREQVVQVLKTTTTNRDRFDVEFLTGDCSFMSLSFKKKPGQLLGSTSKRWKYLEEGTAKISFLNTLPAT
ncbi:hypothetical protein T439DRAFT_356352 [Meredithblackwellia eburnea MCA 4105]